MMTLDSKAHFRKLASLALFTASTFALGCSAGDEEEIRALFVVSNVDTMTAEGLPSRETGVWMGELTHPYWELAGATDKRFVIDIASPRGGRAPIDPISVKINLEDFRDSNGTVWDSGDPDNERFLSDAATRDLIEVTQVERADASGQVTVVERHAFTDTLRLADVDVEDYDMVLFVGGNGVPWQYPQDPEVQRVAAEMWEAGKLVSAVCHGTVALLNARLSSGEYLVAGKQLTGFSTAEEEVLGQREMMPVLMQEEFPSRGAMYTAKDPLTSHVIVDGQLITGQNPTSARDLGKVIVEYFQ
jgi:putative intracellular protease/amidase